MSFDLAYAELARREGGYSNRNRADDPGGETMWGVTERVARAHGYTGPMRDMPQTLAKQIMFDEYWKPHNCDQMPFYVGYQVFDTAVNGGRPAQWLQAVLGVPVDGVIGAKTIAACRAADPVRVVVQFNRYRLDYMQALPNWLANSKGWSDRLMDNILMGLQP